jgi:hypothetical protein
VGYYIEFSIELGVVAPVFSPPVLFEISVIVTTARTDAQFNNFMLLFCFMWASLRVQWQQPHSISFLFIYQRFTKLGCDGTGVRISAEAPVFLCVEKRIIVHEQGGGLSAACIDTQVKYNLI